jgi:hypothetical protein
MTNKNEARIAELEAAIKKKDEALLVCKNTAHSVLIAGGDYGDELSDFVLRQKLTQARDVAEEAISHSIDSAEKEGVE